MSDMTVTSPASSTKTTARQLQETQRRFDELQAEYEEFAYVVSHDFSAPFRQIAGFSKLILAQNSELFDETTKSYFDIIIKNSNNCQRYVDALLQYSRINRKGGPLVLMDCSIAFTKATDKLQPTIDNTGATIECAPLPQALGDSEQIAVVFYHLLHNAMTFRHPDRCPHITVSSEPSSNGIRFNVTDNGIGIEKRHHDTIFGALRKVHSSKQYSGDGVGLAIVRKIIRRHNGTVGVTSEPDVGSTFSFTLCT